MLNIISHAVKKCNSSATSRIFMKSFSSRRRKYNENETDELDLLNVGEMHNLHLSEMEAMKEREKYHIVQRKYFKEKSPNFLTWSDKQQIKHLHASNPDEWTIERLSDGFPVLPETVKKLISSNWSPTKNHRILRHDETVQRNWSDFKEGKFNDELSQELQNHLKKFTTRELIIQNESTETCLAPAREKLVQQNGEFSAIIQSYKNLKQPKARKEPIQNDKYDKSANKSTDFNQLQAKTNIEKSTKEAKPLESNNKITDLTPRQENANIETYQKQEVQLTITSEKYPKLMYPEHIKIPKNIYKKGATYKLEDCFYDSDGEFLYRAPGLL